MSFLSPPKPPKVKNIPVPDRSDAEIQAAAEEQRKLLQSGSGTSYLTGGLGVPSASQSYGAAKLLGAS